MIVVSSRIVDHKIRRRKVQHIVSWHERLLLLLLNVGVIALFLIATTLTPWQDKRGTHQQLGLPPCAFYISFKCPCPACGMTTAWASAVRGDLIHAFQVNVGGTLLVIAASVAVPWLCVSTWYGRWVGWKPSAVQFAWIAALFVGITLTDWLLRLWVR
jgi:hypothetical protein